MESLQLSHSTLTQIYSQILQNQKLIEDLIAQVQTLQGRRNKSTSTSETLLDQIKTSLRLNHTQMRGIQKNIGDLTSILQLFKADCKHKASLQLALEPNSQTKVGRKRKRPYGFYSKNTRQNAVQRVSAGQNVHQVAEELGLDSKNIVRWRREFCQKKTRTQLANDTWLQSQLSQWILKQRQEKTSVTIGSIKDKALSLSFDTEFKLSEDWIFKFLRAHNLDHQTFMPSDTPTPNGPK